MEARDEFYGRSLYSATQFQWQELAKEYIPHFMWFREGPAAEGNLWGIDDDKRGKKERRIGWCSYCEQAYFQDFDNDPDIYTGTYEFLHMKHQESGNCPICDYPVTFINERKMTSYASLMKVRRLIFSDFIDFNHVNFYACRVYNYPDRDQESQDVFIEPASCYELSPGSVKMYRYNGDAWIEQKSIQEPFKTYFGHGGDYEFTLLGYQLDFTDTFLQYFEVHEFENVGTCAEKFYGDRYFYYMTFLCYCCLYPQLEFLMKSGAYAWVYDLVYGKNLNKQYIDWSAKNYADMFRMTKQEVKAFKECNLSKSLLELYYRYEKKVSIIDLCKVFRGYSSNLHTQLIALLNDYNLEIERLNRYFDKNFIMRDRFNSCIYDASFQMWRDYIEACEQLGVDLNSESLLFPKDLAQEHDLRVAQVEFAENKKLIARAQRSLERRDKRYGFEDDRFIIYLPHLPSELVEESNMQDNCVAKNYTTYHFRDETTILFLREKAKPNESLYTIEIKGNTVVQKKGYHNDCYPWYGTEAERERWAYYMSRPRAEADAFFNKWLKWVKAGSPRNANGEPVIEDKKVRKRA